MPQKPAVAMHALSPSLRPSCYTFARHAAVGAPAWEEREAGRPRPLLERQGSLSVYFRVRGIHSPSSLFGPYPQDQGVSRRPPRCARSLWGEAEGRTHLPRAPRPAASTAPTLRQGPVTPGTAGLAAQSAQGPGQHFILLAYFLPFSVFDQVTGRWEGDDGFCVTCPCPDPRTPHQ